MSRVRPVWFLAVLVMLGLALVGCSSGQSGSRGGSSSGSSKLVTVKVGYNAGAIGHAQFIVPKAFGYFQQEGLDVQLVSTATIQTADQLVGSGQLQFAFSDVNQIGSARQNGLDLRIIANAATPAYALMCQKSEGISGSYPAVMQQLKAKSIGISNPGSGLDVLIRYTLIDSGLSASDVKIVPLGSLGSMTAAFTSKQVDCVMAYQPMQEQLASQATMVVNYQGGQGPAAYQHVSGIVAVADQSYIQKNPDVIQKFVRAYQKGIAMLSNPADVSLVASKLLPYFKGLTLQSLEQSLKVNQNTWKFYVTPETITAPEKVIKAVNGTSETLGVDQMIAAPVKGLILKQS